MTQATTGFTKLMRNALSLAVVSVLFTACSKEPVNNPGQLGTHVTQTEKQKIQEMLGKLPSVGIYNRTMDKILVFKRNGDGRSFSFTTAPSNGINFASSNGGQWVWTEDGGMVILTEPAAGFGGGGGMVVAGNSMLNIDIAVCFSVGEEAMGGGLFGPDMGEVAGVIGISGDIEALANGDFDENEDDIFDYFHGFAYYFVYTDHLNNGSYEVMNWLEELGSDDEEEPEFHDVSFAFVVDLQGENGAVYISKDGNINISGGTMEFNGNYYGLTGVGFFDGEGEVEDVTVVSGYGAMGCE
ncbi:MAG TPA: hypothetical protein PKD45_09030 [Flavobacteriales bacterium]|nr:hypothetical protein [Flavobacteriales bacterium]